MEADSKFIHSVRELTLFNRYGVALWVTILALSFHFDYHLMMEKNQVIIFATAVTVASWYGGLGPGLFSAVLSVLFLDFFFYPPIYALDFNSTDTPRMLLFIIISIAISWLNDRRLKAEVKLRQSEETFRSLVEGVRDYAIFMLSPTGRVLSWNAAVERITGYSPQEIVGKHYSCFFSPEDANSGRPDRLLKNAGTDGRADDEDWRVRHDGSRFWASTVITALRDDEGRLRSFSTIMRDLTERRKGEELERQRQAQLARMSRLTTMNELATGIAHELNQPLSAITLYSQGCLDRLESSQTLPADVKDALRHVATQAERAAAIVEHFRGLARQHTPIRTPIDINALVHGALELLQADIRRAKVTISTDLQANMPTVICAQIEIEQVLVNLIKNAVEAMQPEPQPHELAIRTGVEEDARVTVAIRDTGPGLPPGDPDAVFEPFYTTKPDGLGMGLAISRSIIQSHGGGLRASSDGQQRGTTFSIVLPIAPASSVESPQ